MYSGCKASKVTNFLIITWKSTFWVFLLWFTYIIVPHREEETNLQQRTCQVNGEYSFQVELKGGSLLHTEMEYKRNTQLYTFLFQKLYIRNDKTLLENYRSAPSSEFVCRESTLSLVVSHSQVSLLLMVTMELVSCCFFLKHFMKRSKFSSNFHTAQEVLTHQVAR